MTQWKVRFLNGDIQHKPPSRPLIITFPGTSLIYQWNKGLQRNIQVFTEELPGVKCAPCACWVGHTEVARPKACRLKTGIRFLVDYRGKVKIQQESDSFVVTLGRFSLYLSALTQALWEPQIFCGGRVFRVVQDLPECWTPALPNWRPLGKHNKTSVCKCA